MVIEGEAEPIFNEKFLYAWYVPDQIDFQRVLFSKYTFMNF